MHNNAAKKLNTFYRKIKSIQQSQKSINMSEFTEVTITECVICYENIGSKNCCTTECGHQFCFKCIATSMQYNNACPYCRASLVEMPEGDDEEDDDEDSEYESDEDEEMEEEEEDEATPEEIAAALQEKGMTMVDLITCITGRCSKSRPPNVNEVDHTVSIVNNIWDIINDLDAEAKERGDMMNEEIHSMAIALGTRPTKPIAA